MNDSTATSSIANEQIELESLVRLEDRVCPLCSSKIKLFFINYYEKLLMCENTECEFPFGYEDLQIVKMDNCDNETGSIRTKQNFSSHSSISGITVSDAEQLYRACEAENNVPEIPYVSQLGQPAKLHQNNILKNVAPLKDIHSEIMKMNSQMKIGNITDKRMINNLYKLQNGTGVQLLKPQELNCLKMGECKRQSEVKIDINKNENDISVIKIEFRG